MRPFPVILFIFATLFSFIKGQSTSVTYVTYYYYEGPGMLLLLSIIESVQLYCGCNNYTIKYHEVSGKLHC